MVARVAACCALLFVVVVVVVMVVVVAVLGVRAAGLGMFRFRMLR